MDQTLLFQHILTLLSVFIISSESLTVYVSPSADSVVQCGPSCMTLNQFSDTLWTFSRSEKEITLIFLPGHHELTQSNFYVAEIQYLSMRTNSSTVNSLKSTINCLSSSKFLFSFSRNIEIKGLTFNGCIENEINDVSDFQLEDCHLNGAEEPTGRTFLVVNSTVRLTRSYLEQFQGFGLSGGGAIYCFHSVIFMIDCTFRNNTAYSGAVLHADGNSEVIIRNCEFSNGNSQLRKCCEQVKCHITTNKCALVNVPNCTLFDGSNTSLKGGVISITDGNINVHSSTFINNTASYGGAVYCDKGATLNISNSDFIYNVATGHGGVIYQTDCDVRITGSNFSDNFGNLGGVIYHSSTSETNVMILHNSLYQNNEAYRGGVAYVSKSSLNVRMCQFSNNEAKDHGGALFVTSSTVATISSCNFSSNKANTVGGAIRAKSNSRVTLLNYAIFENNSAIFGAAIHLFEAGPLKMNGTITIINNKAKLGCVCIIKSNTMHLDGNVSFIDNEGSLFVYSSEVLMKGVVNFTGHSIRTTKHKNSTVVKMEGGCISLLLSTLNISSGLISFSHSRANNGGGLLAITSYIKILDSKVHIFGMNASDTGGGIYLYQSTLYIRGTVLDISHNHAVNYGGGIHAVSSTIIVHVQISKQNVYTELCLRSNSASKGGGVCFEVNSQFYLTQLLLSENSRKPIRLAENTANYGGAVYVADETSLGTCSAGSSQTIISTSHSECFFQLISITNEAYKFIQAFTFADNLAYVSGPLIFGGLLDRCTVSSFTKRRKKYSNVIGYADGIANETSSHPVKVCLCSPNDTNETTTLCSFDEHKRFAEKGESISLNVVAIDQINHTINATIHSYFSNTGSMEEGQRVQNISNQCTPLIYTLYSLERQETLTLYSKGPCKDLGTSALKISIEFKPCKCAKGFEVDKDIKNKNCECICHTRLQSSHYVKDLTCNSKKLTIIRNKSFWISFENGYFLVYDECPIDYCVPALPSVDIDLESPKGADVQCNYNRSGKLCGQCQKGLTLSLGSSRCIECPPTWPANLIAIVIGTLLAGVLLVVLLLLTNLTVAAGTLNGVIFYANVLSMNHNLFMPFQNPNFHSIFIAWLNLDFGFYICFVKDMDTYVKTWVQLFLPVYLILVVIAIMIVSKYSVRFSRVISPKNPVATLATLILLSYTKLIDTSIHATFYAILFYIPESEGKEYIELVWAYDASVPYLKGKHILLFIVAILIFLVGFVYTFLLLFWQWLVCLPNNVLFKCVRNTKLSSFIDAYHAPFTARNRYWTGLLLLARVILHVMAAITGIPSINLLLISLVIGCILLLQGFSGMHIYKSRPLNILELTTYFNILVYTSFKIYVLQTEGNDFAIAYVSITIEFVIFLCVIAYHISTETNIVHRIKCCKQYKQHICQDLRHPLLPNEHHDLINASVTFSEVVLDKERTKEEEEDQRVKRTMKEREDTTQLFSEEP